MADKKKTVTIAGYSEILQKWMTELLLYGNVYPGSDHYYPAISSPLRAYAHARRFWMLRPLAKVEPTTPQQWHEATVQALATWKERQRFRKRIARIYDVPEELLAPMARSALKEWEQKKRECKTDVLSALEQCLANDTNGDGNCGRQTCMICHPENMPLGR